MDKTRVITCGSQRVFVRDWADGKVLLTSSDDEIKRKWLDIRRDFPDIIEMMTDPDMGLAEEDMEGAVSVVVNPERVVPIIHLRTQRIDFVFAEPAPTIIHGGRE